MLKSQRMLDGTVCYWWQEGGIRIACFSDGTIPAKAADTLLHRIHKRKQSTVGMSKEFLCVLFKSSSV